MKLAEVSPFMFQNFNILWVVSHMFQLELLIRVLVCDCAAYNGPFRNHCSNYSEGFPDDGTQTVPKYVGGNFAHLSCTSIHSNACKVGFISCFVVF